MKFEQVLKEGKVYKKAEYKIFLEFAYDRINKDFIIIASMPIGWDTERNKAFKTVKDFTLYLYHATNQIKSGSGVHDLKVDTKMITDELYSYMTKFPEKFISLEHPGKGISGKWDAIMQIGSETRAGSHSFGVLNLKITNSDGIKKESSKKILPQDVEEKETLDTNFWKSVQDGTIDWSNQSPINSPSITGNAPKQKKRGPEIHEPLSITA